MLYSELLKNQNQQVSKLHADYLNARDQIRQMQKDHFNPNQYKGELERLEAAFKRDCETIDKLHKQQQKQFLNEPEQPNRKPDMNNAYDKSVKYTMGGLNKTEETKNTTEPEKPRGMTVEQKMQLWQEEKQLKTQKKENSQGS